MIQRILSTILSILGKMNGLLAAMCDYWGLYGIIGLFGTRRFPKAKQYHNLAIVVAARNEEAVIGNLLESIRKQDYPADKITTFVVADNCTDDTARVAREHGAICYERFDTERRTKGFALQFLFEQIRKDYGIESYEAYILFDADNLLKSDFVSRMNEAFDAGEKIVTSYRNTKNFDDNWISASYGLHWLRTVRMEHRARSLFGLATRIQGTGFLFSNELVKDGWKYTSLTEDRAFSADAVVAGYCISYCHAAQFYDEQPVDFKIAMRQRIRWAKGHLQAFGESGWMLFKHIFTSKSATIAFMSYDMFCIVAPRALYSIMVYILRFLVALFLWIAFGQAPAMRSATQAFFEFLNLNPANEVVAVLGSLAVFGSYVLGVIGISSYFLKFLQAAYVFLTERKRMKPMPLWKKVWFCITFPIFDMIGRIATLIAVFMKVEWKPIPHNSEVTIDDLDQDKAPV